MVGVEVKVGAEVGLALGQAGDLLAICSLGRDQGGCSVSEEDSAGVSDGRAIRMLVHGSHGFRGGGGPTKARHTCKHHNKSCNLRSSPHNSLLIQAPTDTPTRPIRSTPTRDIGKQMKGG